MCELKVNAQCYNKFFEVSSAEGESAELMVEDAVCRVLLDLFDEGAVDEIELDFTPDQQMGLQHCSIQIHAECACQYFTRAPRTKANMELAIENGIRPLLRELFGSAIIDSVTLRPSPQACENAAFCCLCS